MNHLATVAASALTATLALVGCGTSAEETTGAASGVFPGAVTPSPTAADGATASPSASTSAGAIPPEHIDEDVMFARMTVPHHEQAVEMSEVLLTKDGLDQEVRDRAERLADTQEPEIAPLRAVLGAWGSSAEKETSGDMDHGSMGSGGMMTEADTDQLRAAEGNDAAVLFLEQMIAHHEGAVDMAREQVENGSSPQALELARDVVEDQEAEIDEMETLLERLRTAS